MKARTTIKDLEIRIAVCEQGFTDIHRRLEKIESRIFDLKTITDRGIGAWKGLIFLSTILSLLIACMDMMKRF